MRQEVIQLHRDLTQERLKTKALEEEMATPMNIHRWRKISGNDPDKSSLLDKIQSLQKYCKFTFIACNFLLIRFIFTLIDEFYIKPLFVCNEKIHYEK